MVRPVAEIAYTMLATCERSATSAKCETSIDVDTSPETEPDDQRLVADAQAGDRGAFSELVRRHQAAIYRICFRILYDAEDAADATQDAFVRAYKNLSAFRQQSSFKTWLVRIAVNVSLNARSHQRDGVLLDDIMVDPARSVEDMVVQAEAVRQLHRCLQRLPFKHRAAVVLRDLEGFSYREVAIALAVPEGTAKGWAHRGRALLKELLT